jgi:hypothetical protein
VFGASTEKPSALRSGNEHSATDGYGGRVRAVEVVVCGPEPGVFPVEDGVRRACKKAALKGSLGDEQAVWTSESTAPPTHVCVLCKLTEPGEEAAVFISRSMVPGRTSETVRRMSESSAEPVLFAWPMWSRGREEDEELKAAPEAEVGGTWMVEIAR